MRTLEASELKGRSIPNSAALVERLEEVIDKLEVALQRQRAENERLRRVEKAAVIALADLDALLAKDESTEKLQLHSGHAG